MSFYQKDQKISFRDCNLSGTKLYIALPLYEIDEKKPLIFL